MRRFSFIALLGGLLLLGTTGCGASNPNIAGAEDALETGNYGQALQSVEQEIQANPENAEAYSLKGQILLEQAQSVQAPERRAELMMQARTAYDQAVERDSGMEGRVQLAMQQAYQQEYSRAADAYNMADSLGDASMFEEAAAYFEGAAALQPEEARPLVLAGESYVNAEQYGRAIDPFERSLERGDPEARVYNVLSQLYLSEERYDDALSLLESATETYPDDENLQAQLLTAVSRSGDTERAMTAYEDIIEQNPENADYRYRYGTLLLQNDRLDPAIEQLTEAAELDPNNINTLFNLAAAYQNKAVPINEQIRSMDEERSAQSSELSEEEIQAMDDEISNLTEQQRDLFRQAIDPLERAREALRSGEADNTNLTEQQVCNALYTAYAQTNQAEMAQQVQECAGIEN